MENSENNISERQQRPTSVFRNVDMNPPPPQRTEIPKPWRSSEEERPPLWEPKRPRRRFVADSAEIDESLLVEPKKKIPAFKARKIPTFNKKKVPSAKYSKVGSKIGSDIKQYRIAARRAKIRANRATDQVMASYADGVDERGRRKGANIEASTLANAIVDSGIMADLLADVPGPIVEIFPPPPKREDVRRPTYESIMREIELEAEMENRSQPSSSPPRRANYSSWVGDFGPTHTRMRVNNDDDFVGEKDGSGGSNMI